VRVVEHEPVDPFGVEERAVGAEPVFVIVDPGLLYGAMAAFDLGMALRGLGIGRPAIDGHGEILGTTPRDQKHMERAPAGGSWAS
jgi:hypothetical protein